VVGQDGRIHTTFLQAGTVTGRMSSQNPNLQNIPTRSDEGYAIRTAFIAERGYRLVSIDYSQIELRIAAILSGDEKMIQIFKNGEDVHSAVASRVFGVPEKEVDKEMRRRAKVINFGILYGMGVNALRQNLGEETPRAEAQEFLNAYFNTFTRLAEYLEEVKAFARKTGYTETHIGRRRYFEGIRSNIPFMRASAERMAINAPVQGTAADVMRVAMVAIDEYLTKEKLYGDVRMLLQVHDELVFEIKQSRIAEIVPHLKKIMEDAFPAEDAHGVPLVAEARAGINWGELASI
jgi:DNA polymerase-1